MKNNMFFSFRFKIMWYTCLSLLVTMLADALFLFLCIRAKLFIRTSMVPSAFNSLAQTETGNGSAAANTTQLVKQMLNDQNMFYKLFGVNFKWQVGVCVAVISLVTFSLLFYFLTRPMTEYIREISRDIQRMTEGDFDARIEVRSRDEFSYIAGKMNQMAEELSDIKAREKTAEASKNELITNVAHDLRTPLTSIIGYLELLHERKEYMREIDQKKYIDIAYRKSKNLQNMISELFSFTKSSYADKPMNAAMIDIVKLLEQMVDEFYPSFVENHLKCKFSTELPKAIVAGDGEQLARVFENLMGNAIKYGKDGKIIKVQICGYGSFVKIIMTNYGEVIPEESLPHLFEKFYRVEESRQEKTGGTGLGLAIAKGIVEKHGGQIQVQSSFEGTVFEVMLQTVVTDRGSNAEESA